MLRHMFTTSDNTTGDLGRVLWACVVLSFIGLSSASLYRGFPFDPASWSIAAGTLLASGAGALRLKMATEPDAPPLTTNPAPGAP